VSIRAVFDTNIVLSALLFTNGQLTWLRSAWEKQLLTPIVSKEITEELLRVLAYPKFKLSKEQRNNLLAEYLPFAETFVVNTKQDDDIPLCRDKDDQVFLSLTYQSKAQFLISGDKDLLELNHLVKFKITTAATLKSFLNQ